MSRENDDIEELEHLTEESREQLEQMLEWSQKFSENLEDEQEKARELQSKIQEALEIIDELGDLEQITEEVVRHQENGVSQENAERRLQSRFNRSLERIHKDSTSISVIAGRIKQLYQELHPELEQDDEILEHMAQNDLDVGKKLQKAEKLEREIQKLQKYHNTGERSINV